MTTSTRYTHVAIVLHWIMAVLMLGNIVLIWIVEQVPEDQIRFVIDTHKSIGITVLGLFVLRLLWRLGHRPPSLPNDLSPLERHAAGAAHILLYVLIFALPFSGWLHDSAWKAADTHPMSLFGVVPWPRIGVIMSMEPELKERLHGVFGAAHEWLANGFYVLFALHVLGALKHQFLDHHPSLRRMWF